jgi:hypothetical protein
VSILLEKSVNLIREIVTAIVRVIRKKQLCGPNAELKVAARDIYR